MECGEVGGFAAHRRALLHFHLPLVEFENWIVGS